MRDGVFFYLLLHQFLRLNLLMGFVKFIYWYIWIYEISIYSEQIKLMELDFIKFRKFLKR